jgi:hypothetical protein
MPIELKMLVLSPAVAEGTLAKWLVKEGDTLKSGEPTEGYFRTPSPAQEKALATARPHHS